MNDSQMTRKPSLDQLFEAGKRFGQGMSKGNPSHAHVQKWIGSGVIEQLGKLAAEISPEAFDIEKFRKSLGTWKPFGDEEYSNSKYGYPQGFPKKTLEDRFGILQPIFNLQDSHLDALWKGVRVLQSNGVDEWVDDLEQPYVVPNWRLLAKTYSEATSLVWNMLAESPVYKDRAYNYREGQITEERLRLVDRKLYEQLEKEWGCKLRGLPTLNAQVQLTNLMKQVGKTDEVWPVFAQTGLRHRGRSARRSHVMFSETEWALGPFEIACILLTDGEDRLTAYEHLAIDVGGALYRFESSRPLDGALGFYFSSGRLKLYDGWFFFAAQEFGVASGSLR